MKVLIISHKPPFPVIDGGCLAMSRFLENIHSQKEIENITYLSLSTFKHPFERHEIPQKKFNKVTFIDKYIDTKLRPEKALKDLIHPAGMKLFGEYVMTDNNENYSIILSGTDSNNSLRKSKTFVKTGNTINIYYTTHGMSVNSTVSLEFLSGNYKNVKNGIYTVTKVNTSNYFEVKQPRGYAQSISIVNPGLNYNSNSYIVFTTDYGKSNGFFNVNAYGSIVSSNITDFGRYYNSVPKANANGTNSVAAVFSITLDQYANSDLGNVYVTLSI
jgi:hypothetical protein